MLEILILGLTIYFWGSPVGLASFLGHLGAALISISTLRTISKSYFFWLIIIITLLTSQEKRLSLEYLLLATTFFSIGMNKEWIGEQENKFEKRKRILLIIFLFLIITNFFRIGLSERGSLLLWLPIFLIFYFEKLHIKNSLFYFTYGIGLFLSNKFTAFLAFVFSLRSKFAYLLSIFAIAGYFIYKQNIMKFFTKSFEPRLYVWKSALEGFLDKPIFGHGFGTFALDFPPYRTHAKVLGGRVSEMVAHGHSLFFHFAFELGIIGLLLVFVIFYLIWINKKECLIPLLIISLCDSPLVTFNQYALAGLILVPSIKNLGVFKNLFIGFNNQIVKNVFFVFAIFLSLYIYVPSLIGHFYYSKEKLDQAIFWDNQNPLYYFTRGALTLNIDTVKSESDFLKAIELCSDVPYFHGFLGATQLANKKIEESKKSLEKAIKLDGSNGYWCFLYALANHDDKQIYNKYLKKAFKRNPEIKKTISNPEVTSTQYIGSSKLGDPRLIGFYRTGPKLFFPLPVVSEDNKL